MKLFKQKRKEWLKTFSVFLSVFLLVLLITQEFLFTIAPLKELELRLIDNRFLRRGKIDPGDSSKVVILEIDQESFDQILPPLNEFPLSRSIFTKVIENLNKIGVRAIGIDVLMPTPDQFSPKNDQLFKDVLKKYKNVVLAGKINEQLETAIDEGKYDLKQYSDTTEQNIKYDFGNLYYDAEGSTGIGIVRVVPDNDNIHRRYLPYIYVPGAQKFVPSFGYALLNKYSNLEKEAVAYREGNYFRLGGKLIPRYDQFSTLINFYGPIGTFPTVKLIDVLDDQSFKTKDEVEYESDLNNFDILISDSNAVRKLKDKIVLIGSTMPEDRDVLSVSIAKGEQKGDNTLYGVEFHANAIQNVIDNNFLSRQSRTSEIFFILLLSALAFYGSSFLRKIKFRFGFVLEALNILLVGFLVWGIYEASVFFFINANLVTVIVSPALGVILGYIGSTVYHFIVERQEKVLIRGMFSQYVSREVVNELIANPDKLRLGGEKKNVTILFSDIAGFTTFAENKEPEVLVTFINRLLNELSEIIIANGGTVDKYLGDAVMAFWGAPIEMKEHAYHACLSALKMQDKVAELRDQWSKAGEAPIRIRIGLNTGEAIVGNMGGEKQFNYTVLGDCVNLASRLEGANKEYGSNIMISGSTYELIKDKFLVRELDVIRVKGKKEPTKVYELISLIGDSKAEEAMAHMDFYFQGLELYRLKSFEAAQDYFNRSFEKLEDFPSKVYMNRCKFYLDNPPAEDWDGVFEMKTK